MNKHYAYNSPFKMNDGEGNEYELTVEYDELAEDPREWDNACTMVCWHSRYKLGDKHQFDDSDELCRCLLHNVCGMDWDEIDEIDSTRDKYKLLCESDKLLIKPINMYEHSGITVSTSDGYPYNDRWDSCCIGFIYITKAQVLKECKGIMEKSWQEAADRLIESEMKVYDQYVRGDVYWFCLEKKVINQDKCPHCGEVIKEYVDTVHIDSCGGFYGDCIEENGILEYIGGYTDGDIKFAED
jgi:hypothetical protein